jgi:hypothetical protein
MPWLLPALLFLALHFASWSTPGAYADAINPDYLVVRALYGAGGRVPAWVIPGNLLFGALPVLVHVYHGALPFYLGLPVYALAGTELWGIRVTGAWFGLLLLGSLALLGRSLRLPALAIGLGLAVLASDTAFLLGLRTQFTIQMLPVGLLLLSIALVAGGPVGARRALAAGVLAGLAVYGYFVHAFAVVLMALVLALTQGLGWRARFAWALGAALGLLPYALGYLLVLLAIGPQAVPGWLAEVLATQAPGRSGLGLGERLRYGGEMARLATEGDGAQTMALGEALPMPGLALRRWVLGALALGLLLAAWREPGWRRALLLLCAAAAGTLPLVLLFGDRLWVQHLSPLLIYLGAAAMFALAGLWRAGGAGRALAVGAAALLIGVHLAGWRVTASALEASGGRGLSSDALVQAARVLGERPGVVVTADWGHFMPLAMYTRGRLPLRPTFVEAEVRRALCAGQDVHVTLVPGREPERVAAWSARLGREPVERRLWSTRDGQPALETVTWQAGGC